MRLLFHFLARRIFKGVQVWCNFFWSAPRHIPKFETHIPKPELEIN